MIGPLQHLLDVFTVDNLLDLLYNLGRHLEEGLEKATKSTKRVHANDYLNC